jgi:hypothetical protein
MSVVLYFSQMAMKKRTCWLLLIVLITTTLLCFVFIHPEWLARFVAMAVFWVGVAFALLFYGLHPKSAFLHTRSKIARIGSDQAKKNARRVLRVLTILFGSTIFLIIVVPIMTDCVALAHFGPSHILQLKGRVADNNILLGTYFLNQDIIIIKQGENSGDSHMAMFFPRVARYGNTYWFLVAPSSKFILDWQPVSDNQINPAWK